MYPRSSIRDHWHCVIFIVRRIPRPESEREVGHRGKVHSRQLQLLNLPTLNYHSRNGEHACRPALHLFGICAHHPALSSSGGVLSRGRFLTPGSRASSIPTLGLVFD